MAGGVWVKGLERSFGANKVLHGVSFEVPEGGVCTLLGASGSGKTTTLRLLAGLDRPDGGEIMIGSTPMAGPGVFIPAERRGVGLVFQSYALWPHMRVFDQIAYPLKVRRTARREIKQAVEEVAAICGLSDYLRRYPSQLSGGQQQRVALARALVFKPRLLLLDEPLSNLDAALRRQTRIELEQVQKQLGITTIYVTHDQEEAMAVSDTIVLMDQGRVVSIGPPREIYDRPTTVYSASFVGGSNLIPGRVVRRDDGWVLVEVEDGKVLTGRGPESLQAGEDVMVAIKPVDVLVNGRAEVNVLEGDVTVATYVGPQIELLLRVGRTEFRAPVTREVSLAAGDRVAVHLPPERVRVLRVE